MASLSVLVMFVFHLSRSFIQGVICGEDFPNCLCFLLIPFVSFLFFFRGVRCCHHKLGPSTIIRVPSPISDKGNCRAIVMKCEILFFSHHQGHFPQLGMIPV